MGELIVFCAKGLERECPNRVVEGSEVKAEAVESVRRIAIFNILLG